jgi:hypothetical protein
VSFPAFLGTLLVGSMYVLLRDFWVDPDVWWHTKVGETILATHHWPTVDTYSFTAHGMPWIAYEWLGEVLLAAVERSWGLRGLLVLDIVLAGSILVSLYVLVSMRCRNAKAACVVCAAYLPLVYASCSLRPQMLGYLFLLLMLIIVGRFREGHSTVLWLLPPLSLVWVNTHGTFVLGFLVLGIVWASGLVKVSTGEVESRLWTERERRRVEGIVLLCLVATTITPYGMGLVRRLLEIAGSQPLNVGNISEWRSMSFDQPYGLVFLALILAFILAQITFRPAWRLEELALFVLGIVAACIHVRYVLFFVPFSAPLLGAIVARWFPPYDPANDKYALNAALMGVILAAIVWTVPSRGQIEQMAEQSWPVKSVEYLNRHHVPQPLYNNYRYGGYLLWESGGTDKVFIDGRADLYEPVGVLADYLTISRLGPAMPPLLDSYGIRSCLIQRDEALATVLGASPDWQRVFSDKISVLFVRRNPRARW